MGAFELLSIYNIITLAIVVILFILCKKLIKKASTKDFILKLTSVAVVVIHFSSLYVDYFTYNGNALIENSMILPVYPCNIIMWLLVIVAFMKDRNSNLYKYLAEFTFIGGTLCGMIGVVFNINFLNNPNFFDYYILKGLISHTVMIFGTIYLYLFDYIKIKVERTTISIIIGLSIFSVLGLIINILFAIFDIPSVNAMFMLEPPFKELPFVNYFTIGIFALLVSFVGLNIYEHFALPKEDRWITKIKEKRGN